MTERDFKKLIPTLLHAFERGENVMEIAGGLLGEEVNSSEVIDFAYDLQAGSYTKLALANPATVEERAGLRESVIRPLIANIDEPTICEAGSGESTTLVALANRLADLGVCFFGFDTSFSRVHFGRTWGLTNLKNGIRTSVAVAEMGSIPLADDSIDLVYTNSALEPNRGRESELISELVRVSRKWIVLFEPIYETADLDMKLWMDRHKYVRNLVETTEQFASVTDWGLLEESHLIPRPRSYIVAKKRDAPQEGLSRSIASKWVDPVFKEQLFPVSGGLVNKKFGISYPVLEGIPILKNKYGIYSQALKILYSSENPHLS